MWVGIAGETERLGELAAEVERACVAAGVPADGRTFRPHLTLARARRRPEAPPALPPLPDTDDWLPEEFVLYDSRLGSGGAVHTPVRRYPLR